MHRRDEGWIGWDLWRAQREGASGLAARQRRRLAELVSHARTQSEFYERHYRGAGSDLGDLPPVTKPALMAAFDQWVTDPRITRHGVEDFISQADRVGTPCLGQYFVCTTSGTTGHPGIFVHDRRTLAVYRALSLRLDQHWLDAGQWVGVARRRMRWAAAVGTGGHLAGAGWMEWERNRGGWRSRQYRVFSVQRPLPELVQQLNTFDPAIITTYPSVLEALAGEQQDGRLRLSPVIVEIAGESMSAEARGRATGAFGVPVHDAYAASEFQIMAFDCAEQWLHVNSDWVILEPVEADYSPTPSGDSSHTVLLTNLANFVQPVIRYDLSDSVRARPDPCPCGNPMPAIRVSGRHDDVVLTGC